MPEPPEPEPSRIARVYSAYETSGRAARSWSGENPGNRRIVADLYQRVEAGLQRFGAFPRPSQPLLDIGCGAGDLLAHLAARGVGADWLAGVELLEPRAGKARERVPGADVRVADARRLPFDDGAFSAVVLSTVLSSILDAGNRARVAGEALRVAGPDGIVICYDARSPNPFNREVRALGRRELGRLFPGRTVQTQSLTLLPPLARRLGRATGALYGPLLQVPFLRTHLLALVEPLEPGGPDRALSGVSQEVGR
jgi:SAM-dependent methyltransferase